MNIAGTPVQVIDIFLTKFFDGIKIPKEHRNTSYYRKILSKKEIERYIGLIDRSGFSSQIMYGAKLYNIHMTKHKYRIWINSNWNKDKPAIEGEKAEEIFGYIIRDIRDSAILRNARAREAARAAKAMEATDGSMTSEPELQPPAEEALEREPRFEGV